MSRVWLCACIVPAVVGIIVTDYPPTSTEYNYSYNVVDLGTGDAKCLREMRQGDTVSGSYSLIDPDGTRRTVKYTAGPKIGFKAIVHNEPVATPQIEHHKSAYQHAPHNVGRLAPIPYIIKKLSPGQSYLPLANKDNQAYFRPEVNSRETARPAFNEGQYFIPNKTYQLNRI